MKNYEFDEDEPYVVIEKDQGGVVSFLLGIAIGAGIALLFAPQSGEETRAGISRGARRVRTRAQETMEDVTDRVASTVDEARREVERQVSSARDAIDMKRQQVSRAVEAGRAAAQQARDDLERRIEQTKAAYRSGGKTARGRRARPFVPSPMDYDAIDDEPTGI